MPQWVAPAPKPDAEPRVFIGRVEVVIVGPPEPKTPRAASEGALRADLASRRYLRRA
jgi:hypothetical protein